MNLNLFKFLLSLFKRKLVENTTEKSITIRKLGAEKQETAKFIKALEKIKTLNNLPIK